MELVQQEYGRPEKSPEGVPRSAFRTPTTAHVDNPLPKAYLLFFDSRVMLSRSHSPEKQNYDFEFSSLKTKLGLLHGYFSGILLPKI